MEGDARSGRVATSGTPLAYEATPCESTSTLSIRDHAAHSEWRQPQPAGLYVDALRTGGLHLAVSLDYARRVQVMDAARREVEYELNFPDTQRPDDYDVAPDGSRAVLTDRTPNRCDGHVTRYTAAGQPSPPMTRACELVAALPDGTVLVTGRNGNRATARAAARAALNSSQPRPIVRLGKRQLNGADAVHITRPSSTLSLPRCIRGW
jgi:hypothetical protein